MVVRRSKKNKNDIMILEISNILVSSDIITENFCCDLDKCKGICCVEGDAGAPVTLDEIGGIEAVLDTVWDDMSASAQAVVDKQGVAYTDRQGLRIHLLRERLLPLRSGKSLPRRQDGLLQAHLMRPLSHT